MELEKWKYFVRDPRETENFLSSKNISVFFSVFLITYIIYIICYYYILTSAEYLFKRWTDAR
jgi:uncharacterized membrane protein